MDGSQAGAGAANIPRLKWNYNGITSPDPALVLHVVTWKWIDVSGNSLADIRQT